MTKREEFRFRAWISELIRIGYGIGFKENSNWKVFGTPPHCDTSKVVLPEDWEEDWEAGLTPQQSWDKARRSAELIQ